VSDSSETDAARDEESEWAKIDAALDIPQETDASTSDTVPQGEAAEMRFDLAGVIVNGSSIYSARELLSIYRGYIGTEVSVADLYSISHAITRRYAATTAVVPSQSIQSGIATIRIEESLIGNIILVD
jgi:hemolysin activation/secretion protein